MITIQELNQMSDKELQKELIKARHDLTKYKIGVKTNQKKENHMIQDLKKMIARILTILKEKELTLTSEGKKNNP